MNNSTHIYYFDYLRMISAISVIYMHTAADALRSTVNINWHLMNIGTCFSFTAVPLFFMMSGYLLMSSEKTTDIVYLLKKRLPHLVCPLIGWTVIAAFWEIFRNNTFTLHAFCSQLLSAINSPVLIHFWYMYTLIAIYAISPFLYKMLHSLNHNEKKYLLFLIMLVSFKSMGTALLPTSFSQLIEVDLINKLAFFDGHLCTFILGYFLGNLKKKIPNHWLISTSLLLLSIIIGGTYYLTVKTGTFNQTFQNQSAGFEVLLASCVFLLFKQNTTRECNWFKLVPFIPLSLTIYLMHNILRSFFAYMGVIPATFLETLFITLLNATICFLVAKTAATLKPICFIITGMSYRTACNTCNWIYTYHRYTKRKMFKHYR